MGLKCLFIMFYSLVDFHVSIDTSVQKWLLVFWLPPMCSSAPELISKYTCFIATVVLKLFLKNHATVPWQFFKWLTVPLKNSPLYLHPISCPLLEAWLFSSAIELGYHSSKLCLLSLVGKNKLPENFILHKTFFFRSVVLIFCPQKDRGPQFENHCITTKLANSITVRGWMKVPLVVIIVVLKLKL